MLRETPNNESLIVEYGFADSKDDATFLKNNWKNLAEAVVKSLATYIGVPYTPKVSTGEYVVKSGDTLWSIARNNGISVNELKELNNLTSNALSIGQVLKLSIDAPSTSENEYVVKKGDSLYAIARKYNTTVDELKRINNLSSNNLSIGQILKLKEDASITSPSTQNIYTVKSGDSLYKIAGMFDTTVDDIKRANNLTSNLLSVGQKLLIPSTTKPEVIYTVKSGDTLYSIARAYNTTVSDILKANNLQTSILNIGQKLLIP